MSAISILLIASCLPSVVLLIYIYKKDKVDKEPIPFLLLLFALGALSCLPIVLVESLKSEFCPFAKGSLAYNLYENYYVAGMTEEIGKFIILFLVTHKNKHFNCLFDGVLYAVVVSLGFATLENILYVASYGFSTAVVRALTAVPSHMFDGVLMGYFYTMWHFGKSLENTEKAYFKMGYITQINRTHYQVPYKHQLFLALFVPIAAHGTYDFLCSYGSTIALILFLVLLIALYIICFRRIRLVSKFDNHEANMIASVLYKRYPYLYDRIRQVQQANYIAYYNSYPNPNPAPYQNTNQYQNQNNYTYR